MRKTKTARLTYGLSASLMIVASLTGFLMFGTAPHGSLQPVHAAELSKSPLPVTPSTIYANPAHIAEMYASIEQMRNGVCQFPEALMLPESQKSIYIDSVVGGQVPTIAQDQQVFSELLKKVRCNYTPMLMANSTN